MTKPDIAAGAVPADGAYAGSELLKDWKSLAGATIAMFSGAASLPYATSGMFVTSLQQEFGWSRSAISFGPAMVMLGIAITSPLIGIVVERLEPRRLVAPGMAVVALCFGLMAFNEGSLGQYYAASLGIAFIGNLSGAATLTAIITRRFQRNRGAALGIAMAGAGLTTAVAGPLLMVVITSTGWRVGYLALAGFTLTMAPLSWLLLRIGHDVVINGDPRERHGASFKEAVATSLYWRLTLAFFLVSFGTTGLFVHFVPLLVDNGFSSRGAAGVSSIIGLTIIGSRLVTGFIVDRVSASTLAAVIMILGAVGYAAFLLGGGWAVGFGAFAVGVTFGAETDLVGFMVARYFGLRNYGPKFGLMYGILLGGVVLSPIAYGITRDVYGSYEPMLMTAVALLLVSAVLFLTVSAQQRPVSDTSSGTPFPRGSRNKACR